MRFEIDPLIASTLRMPLDCLRSYVACLIDEIEYKETSTIIETQNSATPHKSTCRFV